jgi:hypothetical protein
MKIANGRDNTISKDMGNTFLMKVVDPLTWKDIALSKQG